MATSTYRVMDKEAGTNPLASCEFSIGIHGSATAAQARAAGACSALPTRTRPARPQRTLRAEVTREGPEVGTEGGAALRWDAIDHFKIKC